jgi:Uma2 family endonuclease
MAESDLHRDIMVDMIQILEDHFVAEPRVYVSGNLLMFDEEGNPRKHVSPDVFVVRGVEKRQRENYLVWQEGKGPDAIIEITSKSTKRVDVTKKQLLYRDVLKVGEYFLFDPTADYLDPPLQGFRLVGGNYEPITPIDGRLPSAVLGLHLEQSGQELRLYDPRRGERLLTRRERIAAETTGRLRAEADRDRVETARLQAETARLQAETARLQVEEENERLRRELEMLRRRSSDPS